MSWLEPIWGLKTVALFDAWSFEHFLCGVSAGSLICTHHRRVFDDLCHSADPAAFDPERSRSIRRRCNLFLLFLIAYSWETLEHYLETGLAGSKVAYWFQGVEFWGNRLIADPLVLLLGCLAVVRVPWLAWPARGVTVVWLFLHIVVFPHSMHLHTLV